VIFGPYPARVVTVHDGDTCTLDIDLGFQVTLRYNCRAYGINAPELNTAAGKLARDFARIILPALSTVTVTSHGWDKYGGRFDGTITLPDGRDWADVMVTAGHAAPLTYP
jgi:micrococcal nuclease